MKKKILAILLTAAMVGLTACAAAPAASAPAGSEGGTEEPSATTGESDVDYIKGKGSLIVGITNFEPMDYPDEDGNWIGFDAELAEKVAESLGVECEFVEIDWDNKILELDNKSIDCVWNGMTLTDEVQNSMECTRAYCNNAQTVVMKAEGAENYPDSESMKSLSFAVENGSAGAAAAEEAGFKVTAMNAQADALMEVAAGTSDACVIDLLMAGAMIGEGTSYPDLIHTINLTSEEYGVGCRKGSDLAAYIDEQLDQYSADGSLGEIAKTYGVQDALTR